MDKPIIDEERIKLRDSQPITLTAIYTALQLIDQRNDLILKYRTYPNSIHDGIYVDVMREFNNKIKAILGI